MRSALASLLALAACTGDPQPGRPEPAPARDDTASVEESPPPRPVPLPAPREGHRLELVGGGLLSFGGFGDPRVEDRETRQTWWLAPDSAAWTRRADMLAGRAFFGSAVVAGDVFAIGESVERYDARADRWTTVLPAGRLPKSHFAAAAVGSTIYVLGGYGGAAAALFAIDVPAAGEARLRELPPPPGFAAGDHFHVLRALAGKLHVVGGFDGETFTPKAEHWVLEPDGWRSAPPPPVPVWAKFTVSAVHDGRLHLFGDCGGWRFDPADGSWRERARPPFLIVMPQAFARAGSIFVVGGSPVGVEDDRRPLLLEYDVAADRWTEAAR